MFAPPRSSLLKLAEAQAAEQRRPGAEGDAAGAEGVAAGEE